MSTLPRILAAAAALSALIAGGCAPTIAVEAGTDATDPACGMVLVRTPETLDGLARRQTTSQSTTAWGDAGKAITLQCGVQQPGPSADCLSVTYGDTTVDWISAKVSTGWRFTTYGRTPAVELNVPDSLGLTQPGLTDLSDALTATTVTAHCE
ncbi:DUF3515 family protein [Rarobacter incanus]|uniref:Uncharacterized protein DUF3515 n=1 Tax=Rarobacter incanus TaxID=153494 RepID=A0A542SRK1_9MICO|nr:DUF3515 family protein [Rarobacter incanus]TQK77256.1 uncharacterized protein DUF3515 [Rarobacter incanus]